MLVQQILKTKGDEVFTALPETLIADAAAIMAKAEVGVLIISPGEGRVIGILSERDIVRALAEQGAACLTETVEALMTRDPVSARLSHSDKQVLTEMTKGRFRHMPVIEDNKLIAVVTLGDIVKARLQELAMENESLQGMIMGR